MSQETTSNLSLLFEKMWEDYCQISPQAKRIFNLFSTNGEVVLNDHIAFRTFNIPGIRIDDLAKVFETEGYRPSGEYHFPQKKLYAKHWQHENEQLPKIFISEFKLEEGSTELQRIVTKLVKELTPESVKQPHFLYSGRPWKITTQEYLKLAEESEYASWMAAFGFRPNHFTINVNAFKKFNSIEKVNEFLQKNGFKLNMSGGLIKGTPEEMLEQSSTMAEKIKVSFVDGVLEIPSCYYEFAKRYPQKDGKLYHGFIAQSADKIFESTNRY